MTDLMTAMRVARQVKWRSDAVKGCVSTDDALITPDVIRAFGLTPNESIVLRCTDDHHDPAWQNRAVTLDAHYKPVEQAPPPARYEWEFTGHPILRMLAEHGIDFNGASNYLTRIR